MLDLENVSLVVGEVSPVALLQGIDLHFGGSGGTGGQLVAVLGPSGCGKSTLLKVIAGLLEESGGTIRWRGKDVGEDGEFESHEVGYVPQFSIAHEKLRVWECVEDAVRLRCGGLDGAQVDGRVDAVLREVGMEGIAEKRVEVLSGGQLRRVGLGMELVSEPQLLLCDEVTSGLDPRSEDEITHLMKSVASKGRIVLNITHSLRNLELYDSVVVLFQGRLAFHGPPGEIPHYFGISHHEELYPRLTENAPEEWAAAWRENGEGYEGLIGCQPGEKRAVGVESAGAEGVASGWVQFWVLFKRRWRLLGRDAGQIKLQLALLFGFPCLVVIFALNGLPALRAAAELPEDPLRQLVSDFSTKLEYLKVGGTVSGLIMFQVVLLTLMGANNAAREIAGERRILEKEKFSGLSPWAYVASKVAFLVVLVAVQSLWMAVFVNSVIRMPGNLALQSLFLILVNGAMTATSLGISGVMRTAEQSSLVSVYLVGFQLPLSGAVLALPEWLGRLTRPFIASYWGWSGFLQTLEETRFYNAVVQMIQTPLMSMSAVVWVLGCHCVLGVVLGYIGSRESRWS
ncbi:MAG: hypothetical protein RLZZ399_830 [Verrucomicrobiota bacterium]